MIIIKYNGKTLIVYENKPTNKNRIFQIETEKVMFNNWDMPAKKTTSPKAGRKNS